MKKILFMMSLCALAFASCQKAEIEEVAASAGQNTYTFVVNNVSETKATIGDKNGTQWPVLWAAGDQIGVYGGGQLLGVATLDEGSAGSNRGNFTLTTDATLSAGDELYFSYPYVEGAEMKKGQVAEKHTVTAAGIGANGVAYAYADYAGANTEFTLTHLNAYLKFNLSSSEFAGYSLKGITFWAKGAKLSGGVEVGNGDAVTYTGAGDYVKTTLATPTEMSTTAQPVYVSVLPEDLTGKKDVYAIVHMTKGIETVTLPVKINGAGNIPAGSVTEITLPALTKSLAPKWYEPVETRYVAAYGDGWSYGPENTVLFIGDDQEKTIEVKARGNFMKVKQPAKIKVNNVHSDKGMIADALFINDTDGNTTDPFDLAAGCTFKAKMSVIDSYGYFSNLLVQDASGKTIWGLNLWLVEETMQTAQYTGGTVVDRNIGACGVTSKRKNYRCQGAYFQWGRPFGFPWSTSNKGTSYATTNNTNDLQKSAENPFVLYGYDNGGNGDGYPWDWLWGDGSNKDRSGDLDDLWGNPQSGKTDMATVGLKSIYDPCPKGYKVVVPSVINEVSSNVAGELDKDNKYVSSGAAVVCTDNSNSHYVVYKDISWGFHGFYAPAKSMSKIGDAKTGALAYWSNANYQANAHQWYFRINGSKLENGVDRTRAAAMPIRCMVDTENR